MTAWDLAVVGAGPAGSATAIGALRVHPSIRVALLDRAEFPRDRSCGDGIAPQVIDLLADVGVAGIVDGHVPVPRLRLDRGSFGVDRTMVRPTWVIPRTIFDLRLVDAAQAAGATLLRHRVRELSQGASVVLDGEVEARTVVGADGAHSVVRRALGLTPRGRWRSRSEAIPPTLRTMSARRSSSTTRRGNRRTPGPSTVATGSPTSGTANCSATGRTGPPRPS